ncbi:hypothetical protein NQ318_017053 [Aromia moschata]|uniref:Uncharacterized protein n=1 Tax=Aromia moschata TaxID=1265417 RepID=A0AAV8Y981_9CUCU|nr:hypothetical protein NQ318_017053 [Aromia moschata]
MADYGVQFVRGFTLDEALHMLEDDDDILRNIQNITVFPPENACGDITDEDSGNGEEVQIHNLPGSQLRAPSEIQITAAIPSVGCTNMSDSFSSDDELPLAKLVNKEGNTQRALKRKRKEEYK